MATQLVLVQSLGVRVLPSEQEAVSTTVATMTAAQALQVPGPSAQEWIGPRSSRGLGRQILNLVARVRIPYGVPRGRSNRGPALWFQGEGRFPLRGFHFGV